MDAEDVFESMYKTLKRFNFPAPENFTDEIEGKILQVVDELLQEADKELEKANDKIGYDEGGIYNAGISTGIEFMERLIRNKFPKISEVKKNEPQ